MMKYKKIYNVAHTDIGRFGDIYLFDVLRQIEIVDIDHFQVPIIHASQSDEK